MRLRNELRLCLCFCICSEVAVGRENKKEGTEHCVWYMDEAKNKSFMSGIVLHALVTKKRKRMAFFLLHHV